MVILHNRYDEESRSFVAQAISQYGTAATVIDWHSLDEKEKTDYVRAGLSPSAFPSVVADADAWQAPRMERDETGKEVAVLDGGGKPVMDAIPARLTVIRKPATVAQAVAECAALGRAATPQKLRAKLEGENS